MRILLIDDHPIIVDGYRNILLQSAKAEGLIIDDANSCRQAYEKLYKITEIPYDLILLDMSLPEAEDIGIYSGEDLGLRIRKDFPNTKLMILTSYENNFRLYNILKNLNPDAFLLKKDANPKEIRFAIEKVISGGSYYSQGLNDLFRVHFSSDFLLDELDRKILYFLSKGYRTKDLPAVVALSLAAIEKRKRSLKKAFELEEIGDLALVDKARELGFL